MEKQFIEYVVKQLVDNPDEVQVDRTEDDRGILLKLIVAPTDLGRVIGKHGATAQSLRNILRALGTKNNSRYNLKIVDTDAENSEKTDESPKSATEKPDSDNDVDNSPAESVENESDFAKSTRAELAELDDLDI